MTKVGLCSIRLGNVLVTGPVCSLDRNSSVVSAVICDRGDFWSWVCGGDYTGFVTGFVTMGISATRGTGVRLG